MNATARNLWIYRGKFFVVSFFAMFVMLLTGCTQEDRAKLLDELECEFGIQLPDMPNLSERPSLPDLPDVSSIVDDARDATGNALQNALDWFRSRRDNENVGVYIMAPPDSIIMPVEGGGFIYSENLGTKQVDTIYLFIPHQTASFFYTGATLEEWIRNEVEYFVYGKLILQPVLQTVATSLDAKFPGAGQLLIKSYKLNGQMSTIQSFINTLADIQNDRNLLNALSYGEGFIRMDTIITRDVHRGNIPGNILTSSFSIYPQPHISAFIPIKDDWTFHPMSNIIDAIYREARLDFRIGPN